MPTNVGRANIGTKIFQGRVETRYGEGLKKSVVNEAGDFSAVVRSILRRHDIYEKEPDHDEHQNPSDVHGPPSHELADQTAQYRKQKLTVL